MAQANTEKGGLCYLACDELFDYYNNSRTFCKKGCDYAHGRVNYPSMRAEAERMCKRMTAESIDTQMNLDDIKDLRVSASMLSDNPAAIYKACLAGIRRQKF